MSVLASLLIPMQPQNNNHTNNNSQSVGHSARIRITSSESWLPLRNLPTMLMTRSSFKVNEDNLLNLAIKARLENRECGYLSRRGGQDQSSSPNKWQLKWFVLYQNLLFYYDNVNASKPQGVYFLESCYASRSPAKNSKDGEKLVSLQVIKFCFSSFQLLELFLLKYLSFCSHVPLSIYLRYVKFNR